MFGLPLLGVIGWILAILLLITLIIFTRYTGSTRWALFLYIMQLMMFPKFKTQPERVLRKLVERYGNEDLLNLLSRAKNSIEYLARNDLKDCNRDFIALCLYEHKYTFPE